MSDQWQELKETIVELRDSNGTGTQQEVCKFLVNYMGILEKQMQESVVSKQVVIDIVDSYSESKSNVEDVTQDIISNIMALPPVNPQEPKTGHWIDIYGGVECDKCGKWYPHAPIAKNEIKFCSECGAKMSEPQERNEKE